MRQLVILILVMILGACTYNMKSFTVGEQFGRCNADCIQRTGLPAVSAVETDGRLSCFCQ